MRILYLAGRELSYPRNDVILRALKRFGKVDTIGLSRRPASLILSSIFIALKALPRLLLNQYDIIFVGFYGYLLIFPVSLFTKQPIIFDAFISTFDTLSGDRKIFEAQSLGGRLSFGLDRTATLRASKILLDTPLHAEFFVNTFGISPEKIYSLPVGCNEDLFFPLPKRKNNYISKVLYYSSYMPLHGVETVVRAAGLLKSEAIEFRLIGKGPCYKEVQELVKVLDIKNINFISPVPLRLLPSEIAAADICLGGHFGKTEKAARVVPGKIYQILAMEKPLIAANTRANLDLLQHEVSAYLCSPNDPDDLARSILHFHENPRSRNQVAKKGRAVYEAMASEEVITRLLKSIVEDLVR